MPICELTAVQNLIKPISSSTFSFKKFISNIDNEKFLTNSSYAPYHCKDSPLKDQDHYHILTGNL